VRGHLQREAGVIHLIADELSNARLPDDPGRPRSRDFH
jgi:hypothetical protein